jgi:hypothetical protein
MGGGTAEYGEVWAAACNGVRANGGEAVPLSNAFGANGSHRTWTDGHWPVSACGPEGTTVARRCACAMPHATSRAWARSAQFEIRLAMFDC